MAIRTYEEVSPRYLSGVTEAFPPGGIGETLDRLGSPLSDDPDGPVDDRPFRERLDSLVGSDLVVLDDRLIPGTRETIQHLVITRNRIWVISQQHDPFIPERRVEGGIIRNRVERLVVGSLDATVLVGDMLKQVGHVRAVVGKRRITGALCFVDAPWPLVAFGFTTYGVEVTPTRKLVRHIAADNTEAIDPTTEINVHEMGELLAAAFPPAQIDSAS